MDKFFNRDHMLYWVNHTKTYLCVCVHDVNLKVSPKSELIARDLESSKEILYSKPLSHFIVKRN